MRAEQTPQKQECEANPGPAGAGWLRDCLMDGDEGAVRRARSARRRALFISLALQFGVLAAVTLVPLFALVPAPRLIQLIPMPPYARGTQPKAARAAQGRQPTQRQENKTRVELTTIVQPPRIPRGVGTSRDSSAPLPTGPELGYEAKDGVPDGVIGAPPEVGRRPPEAPKQPKEGPPAETPRMRISEGIQQAMLIYRAEPVYPPLARQIHLEGTVRLHAIVGRDGAVRDLELLSGPLLLAQSALEAVRRWRYRPTILNGEAVEVDTYITVVFQLSR